MRAVRCSHFGPPSELAVEELPSLTPGGAGEVVVQVKAAGINFPDSLIIQDKSVVGPDLFIFKRPAVGRAGTSGMSEAPAPTCPGRPAPSRARA